MLTPLTRVHCPDLIRGGRGAWTGTLADAFRLDDHLWDKLGDILAEHAPTDEDEDDDRSLEQSLADLDTLDDLALVRDLMDDPNAQILADEDERVGDGLTILEQIRAGAEKVADAQEALRLLVKTGREEGINILTLASAAGVTRQTIYNWVGETATRDRVNVLEAIDGGLFVIAARAPQASSNAASRRMGTNAPMLTKIQALRTGTGNVRIADLTARERAALDLALAVAGKAEASHKRRGGWPTSVARPLRSE